MERGRRIGRSDASYYLRFFSGIGILPRTPSGIPGSRHRCVPIVIASPERSGTTLLMKQLLDRPEIAVADTFPFEIELMTYYASALSVLLVPRFDGAEADPDLAEAALATARIGRNPWNRPALHRAIGGEELARMFAESVPLRMSSLFKNIILDYYGPIARKAGKYGLTLSALRADRSRGGGGYDVGPIRGSRAERSRYHAADRRLPWSGRLGGVRASRAPVSGSRDQAQLLEFGLALAPRPRPGGSVAVCQAVWLDWIAFLLHSDETRALMGLTQTT
jgi:hypothetical protein